MSNGAEKLFQKFITHAFAKGRKVDEEEEEERTVENVTILTKKKAEDGTEVLCQEVNHNHPYIGKLIKLTSFSTLGDPISRGREEEEGEGSSTAWSQVCLHEGKVEGSNAGEKAGGSAKNIFFVEKI